MDLQDHRRQTLNDRLTQNHTSSLRVITEHIFPLADDFRSLQFALSQLIVAYFLAQQLHHSKDTHYPPTTIHSPRQIPLNRFRRMPDHEGCSFSGKVYSNY